MWCMLSCNHWSCTSKLPLRSCSSWYILKSSLWQLDTKDGTTWLSFLIHPSNDGGIGVVPSTTSISSFPRNRTLIWNCHMWKFCPENLLIIPKCHLYQPWLKKKCHKHDDLVSHYTQEKLTQVHLAFSQAWQLDSHKYCRHNILKQ